MVIIVKFRLNFSSDKEHTSISKAAEGKTSSAATEDPTKEESRTWRCTPWKSWEDSPLTWSMVKKKLNLLPGGTVLGAGDDARVDGDELRYLGDKTTLTTLMSTRQEPMASEVYRQNMGTVEFDDSRRESVASEIKAFPMNEYSGGGESKKGSSEEKCWVYEGRSMYVVKLRMRCSCCCIRSNDQGYIALCLLSRTLTATDGCVADVNIGSATSPN